MADDHCCSDFTHNEIAESQRNASFKKSTLEFYGRNRHVVKRVRKLMFAVLWINARKSKQSEPLSCLKKLALSHLVRFFRYQ